MPADSTQPTKATSPSFPIAQRLTIRGLIAEVRRSRELLGLALPLNPRPPTDDEIRALEREVEKE